MKRGYRVVGDNEDLIEKLEAGTIPCMRFRPPVSRTVAGRPDAAVADLGDYFFGGVAAGEWRLRKGRRSPTPLMMIATMRYHMDMRQIGIEALKNEITECVRLVAGGETMLVVDGDHVVAELIPPRSESRPGSSAFFSEAVRKGWITPARLHSPLPPPPPPVTSFKELMRELEADRQDR